MFLVSPNVLPAIPKTDFVEFACKDIDFKTTEKPVLMPATPLVPSAASTKMNKESTKLFAKDALTKTDSMLSKERTTVPNMLPVTSTANQDSAMNEQENADNVSHLTDSKTN